MVISELSYTSLESAVSYNSTFIKFGIGIIGFMGNCLVLYLRDFSNRDTIVSARTYSGKFNF